MIPRHPDIDNDLCLLICKQMDFQKQKTPELLLIDSDRFRIE